METYSVAEDGSNFNTSIRDFCTTPESNKDIPGIHILSLRNLSLT